MRTSKKTKMAAAKSEASSTKRASAHPACLSAVGGSTGSAGKMHAHTSRPSLKPSEMWRFPQELYRKAPPGGAVAGPDSRPPGDVLSSLLRDVPSSPSPRFEVFWDVSVLVLARGGEAHSYLHAAEGRRCFGFIATKHRCRVPELTGPPGGQETKLRRNLEVPGTAPS